MASDRNALSLVGIHGRYWAIERNYADNVRDIMRGMSVSEYLAATTSDNEQRERENQAFKHRMQENLSKTGSRFSDMVDANGILRMQMEGPITERLSSWSSRGIELPMFNSVIEGIQAEKGTTRQTARGLALYWNSPGGVAIPSMNSAKMLAELSKDFPILSYANGMLASAAVAMSVPSHKLITSPNCIVGGVACVVRFYEYRKAEMGRGIDYYTFASGEGKIEQEQYDAEGNLSQEAQKSIQKEVDKIGGDFVKFVKEQRQVTDEKKLANIANGGYWINDEALKSGLIDGQMLKSQFDAYAVKYVKNYYKGK